MTDLHAVVMVFADPSTNTMFSIMMVLTTPLGMPTRFMAANVIGDSQDKPARRECVHAEMIQREIML